MFLKIWIFLVFLVFAVEFKKVLVPKIEISMMLEELTSKEIEERKKGNSEKADASMNNSTSSEAEASDDSTTDLLKSVVTVSPVIPDYDAASPIPAEPETTTSSKPMLLSEFANLLAAGIQPRITTTTPPLPDFPTPTPDLFSQAPDESFPFMVSAAKDFIRRYLSPEQWRKLRILLKTIKEVGGSRQDIHRAATVFISKVISKAEMAEITNRRRMLFQTFSKRYFDTA